jgi:hypothetical protein
VNCEPPGNVSSDERSSLFPDAIKKQVATLHDHGKQHTAWEAPRTNAGPPVSLFGRLRMDRSTAIEFKSCNISAAEIYSCAYKSNRWSRFVLPGSYGGPPHFCKGPGP